MLTSRFSSLALHSITAFQTCSCCPPGTTTRPLLSQTKAFFGSLRPPSRRLQLQHLHLLLLSKFFSTTCELHSTHTFNRLSTLTSSSSPIIIIIAHHHHNCHHDDCYLHCTYHIALIQPPIRNSCPHARPCSLLIISRSPPPPRVVLPLCRRRLERQQRRLVRHQNLHISAQTHRLQSVLRQRDLPPANSS